MNRSERQGILQELINPALLAQTERLRSEFKSARPFHHVVIDDFLKLEVAEALLAQFPSAKDPDTLVNEFGDRNPKSQISEVRLMEPEFQHMDRCIQTTNFLNLMSDITGIPDLKYDPWYFGAGTHENFHGAGLDPHCDFNIHPTTGQHRRLNVIIYLNTNWEPGWKGSICFHSDPYNLRNDEITEIAPIFNRCVIFETHEHSWHSVPPVTLPLDKRHLSRKSFTIYLYTDTRPSEETAPQHGTIYVQANLPAYIKPGRMLTDDDLEDILQNIERRNSYLRQLYKREQRFSKHVDDLHNHIRELKRTSYIPLLGYAKIEHVTVPLFPDRFMGSELSFSMRPLRPVDEMRLFGYRPNTLKGRSMITLRAGHVAVTRSIENGPFAVDLHFSTPLIEATDVLVSSDSVFTTEGDQREISYVIDRIELTHNNSFQTAQ